MDASVIWLHAFNNEYVKIAEAHAPRKDGEVYDDVLKKYPHLVTKGPPAKDKVAEVPAPGGLPAPVRHSRVKSFMHGAGQEIGPAVGMMAGAGLGHMLGVNELAASGAGYGLGALGQLGVEALMKRRSGG